MSKTILRALLLLFGVIALITGGASAFGGTVGDLQLAGLISPLVLSTVEGAVVDNNFRFFGGVWMGVGFMLLYSVVRWEDNVVPIRFAALAIFIGGLGRMMPWLSGDLVPEMMYPPIVLEIVVMPLLVFWDSRIRAKQAA
ncbi:MAG: hypothetical protein COA62_05245 [Rhodobiaceae bacterium]|nr:MAG: hypothetical protein COA62_05245 [Rhodobiaceae bacterium]